MKLSSIEDTLKYIQELGLLVKSMHICKLDWYIKIGSDIVM